MFSRSTVSFAKEVSDAKAMEEATRQIENRFGGGKEDSVIAKLGSHHTTTGAAPSPSLPSKQATLAVREEEVVMLSLFSFRLMIYLLD